MVVIDLVEEDLEERVTQTDYILAEDGLYLGATVIDMNSLPEEPSDYSLKKGYIH